MATLEKLLTIDDSDFETLVVIYLRRRKPELKGLIHTGINAEGQPIKCPVDAVLHVPGTPSELVHVAATIHKTSEIKRKWLGGKKAKNKYEPGDIAKADEEFANWTHEPDAKRKLYLGWNRSLENDTELYRDAKARCKALNIELEVIEASQLVDFLDNDPEGQYLRQEFLGIEAHRLSESLLRAIAIRSLDLHRTSFGPSDPKEYIEINRDAGDALERVLNRGTSSLIGVVAPSGAGKSTLVRQSGVRINSEGGICIWVPAEDVEPHISATTLLLRAFRRFYPALNGAAGDDALEIASTVSTGLVLLVDDVNRARSPSEALEGIRLCARSDVDAKGQSEPRIRFVVPMWPNLLNEQPSEVKSTWETIELDYYSRAERQRLAGARFSGQYTEILSVIDSLGGDPFLCDLALASIAREELSPTAGRATIIKSIIVDVLTRATSEAAQSQDEATQDEFAKALERLVEHMLAIDDPEPTWESVRAKLGDRTATLLLQLGKTNRIGWVEQRLDGSYWRWKHDRLRDAIVGRWLATQVPSLLSANNSELARLMGVPGAAEAWAWALAFSDSTMQGQLIEMLGDNQPLALAASLALVEFKEKDGLVKSLQAALDGYSLAAARYVEKPLWPVLYRLTRTNDPLVLQITYKLERNWHVNLGRFRNGETRAGLLLMARFFGSMGMNFPALNRATEEYARLHDDRQSEIAQELSDHSRDPEQLVPVLGLCGYLGWEELTDVAWKTWQAASEEKRQDSLIPLIWALCRCASKQDQGLLEEALSRARIWSNEEKVEANVHHASERYDEFTEPLHFTLDSTITEAAASTLAKFASDNPDLRKDLLYILRGIDMPQTVEAYVRLTAEFGGTFMDHIESFDRPGENRQPSQDVLPVNAASREKLWQMIRGDESEENRKVAFLLWKRFPVADDLQKLRAVPQTDPLFEETLKVRLHLRDQTAAPLLVQQIKTQPDVWCPYAYAVYDEIGVADALFDNFETALASGPIEKQHVERIPQNLPREGVLRLLREKEETLRKSPKLWRSLWRSDVPEALNFVRQVLNAAENKDLERFAMGGNSYPVSKRMFAAISPVLDRFPESTYFWLVSTFLNAGLAPTLESSGIDRKVRAFKGRLRMWLNEDDARKVFSAAARCVPHGPQKVTNSPNFHDIEGGSKKLSFDPRKALREWIGELNEEDHIVVAGMLLARIGLGVDASWWAQLDPGPNSAAHETWQDALYILRRRRWQKHD